MPISDIYSSQMGGQPPCGQKEPPEIVAPNPSLLSCWQDSALLTKFMGDFTGGLKDEMVSAALSLTGCRENKTFDNNAAATRLTLLPSTTFLPVIFSTCRQNMKQPYQPHYFLFLRRLLATFAVIEQRRTDLDSCVHTQSHSEFTIGCLFLLTSIFTQFL